MKADVQTTKARTPPRDQRGSRWPMQADQNGDHRWPGDEDQFLEVASCVNRASTRCSSSASCGHKVRATGEVGAAEQPAEASRARRRPPSRGAKRQRQDHHDRRLDGAVAATIRSARPRPAGRAHSRLAGGRPSHQVRQPTQLPRSNRFVPGPEDDGQRSHALGEPARIEPHQHQWPSRRWRRGGCRSGGRMARCPSPRSVAWQARRRGRF